MKNFIITKNFISMVSEELLYNILENNKDNVVRNIKSESMQEAIMQIPVEFDDNTIALITNDYKTVVLTMQNIKLYEDKAERKFVNMDLDTIKLVISKANII